MTEKFDVLNRITQLRKIHNMSVYKLAKLSGIPQSTIATWYQKRMSPPVDKLECICRVFDMSLADFFYEEGSETALSDQEMNLIYMWRNLNDNQRSITTSLFKELNNVQLR